MDVAMHGESGVAPGGNCWQVGDLLVDRGRRTVERDGVVIPLPALSFDLLAALIESAPDLATIDQLLTRVWGRVVVSPETLSQRVKLLRDALGDDPRQPRYVLGVRGRGYRLVPQPRVLPREVARSSSSAAPTEPPETASSPDDRRRRRRLFLTAAAAVVLAAVAGTILVRAPERETPDRDAEGPAPARPAIAVLPFATVRGTSEERALADGIAEAVLHRLGALRDVTVIARRSSFALREEDLDTREIGRRLGATHLLSGSVQSSEGIVRVRTELNDTRSGSQLWSVQSDHPASKLFAIQDEIAGRIAASLVASPASGPAPNLRNAGTTSAAAQLAILQARALIETARVSDLEAAIARCDEALRLDPASALAHATAAEAWLALDEVRDDQRQTGRSDAAIAAAAHADQALAIDPDSAEALVARARVAGLRGEAGAAERDFHRALDISPNDADGWRQFARFMFYRLDPVEHPVQAGTSHVAHDRYELARTFADRARRIDPLSPMNQYVRGLMAQHLGANAEAEVFMLGALELDPNFHPALARLAQYRWFDGNVAEAIAFGERAIAIDPRADWIRRLVAQFYVDIGEPRAGRSVLDEGGPQLADGMLAVLLYEGHFVEAGNVAARDSARQPRTWDRDFSAFALRERARRAPAMAAETLTRLQERVAMRQTADRTVIHHGSRFAALMAADMLIESGMRPKGERLARDVLDAIDADVSVLDTPAQSGPARADVRQRALALALLGEQEPALQALAELVSHGRMRHLWYDIERQPAFRHVRAMPPFRPVLEQFRARTTRERALLDELRAKGAVPRRG